jgi:hypothetical protein
MLQQFKNMNELAEYLGTMEERLRKIEVENRILRETPPNRDIIDANTVTRSVFRYLPQTNLFSPSFLKRAFAVWGHFFVANLIIGITVGIAYACLMMVLFGSMFGSLLRSPR